uniref:CMP-sialic acid transporter n=1 Tax=Zooxanthella nutricula TaxID=1333877 RepID=A0A7S2HXG2_9DINO
MNNQISFYVYTLADPGTIFLFKAGSTLIVATIQCLCVGKRFSGEQWKAMLLQCVGMVVVQYNPCQSSARYQYMAYVLMAFSTLLTACCSVRNEYLVKNYTIGLNVQQMIMYCAGVVLNVSAFFCLPNPNNHGAAVGFFDGYDSPLALGVVFSNAIIGLAVNAVYKYADAITKCVAGDVTAVLLCIVSAAFFGLKATVTMWCGVFVVCFAVHTFTGAPSVGARPATGDGPASKVEPPVGKTKEEEELRSLIGKTDTGK